MGEDPRATALLRLSLGRDTDADDVAAAAERIVDARIDVAAASAATRAAAARR